MLTSVLGRGAGGGGESCNGDISVDVEDWLIILTSV